MKSSPFDKYIGKKKRHLKDGFKDSVIWYEIIDFLKSQKISKSDKVFFFTQNDKDLYSEENFIEFKSNTGLDLSIIKFDSVFNSFTDSGYQRFLKDTIKDVSNLPIENIEVNFSSLVEKIQLESVIVNPYSLNLLSLIDVSNINQTNYQEIIKESVPLILKNFGVYSSKDEINYSFLKIEALNSIFIKLRNVDDDYFEILYAEIIFENNKVDYIEFEDLEIPFDSVKIQYYSWGHIFYGLIETAEQIVTKALENLVNLKIDKNLIHYSFLDINEDD